MATKKTKAAPAKESAAQLMKTVRQQTRKKYSAEEKIRVVMEGLHGNIYYQWPKEFMEAGKVRLKGKRRAGRSGPSAEGERGAASGGGGPDGGSTDAQKRFLLKLPQERRRYQRMSGDQKQEALRLVECPPLPITQTLRKLQVSRRTYYR